MRFIINIVCFLFLLPLIATAQTYKYIGVENGLSNRRIFDIQKDSVGYMWFLTNEGIDRYNGKDIKHYKLIEENKESSFPIHLGWLYFEEKGKLWVIINSLFKGIGFWGYEKSLIHLFVHQALIYRVRGF